MKKDGAVKKIKNQMFETIKKKGPAFKNGELKKKFVGGPGKHLQVSVYNSVSHFLLLVINPKSSWVKEFSSVRTISVVKMLFKSFSIDTKYNCISELFKSSGWLIVLFKKQHGQTMMALGKKYDATKLISSTKQDNQKLIQSDVTLTNTTTLPTCADNCTIGINVS